MWWRCVVLWVVNNGYVSDRDKDGLVSFKRLGRREWEKVGGGGKRRIEKREERLSVWGGGEVNQVVMWAYGKGIAQGERRLSGWRWGKLGSEAMYLLFGQQLCRGLHKPCTQSTPRFSLKRSNEFKRRKKRRSERKERKKRAESEGKVCNPLESQKRKKVDGKA